jgi:hypothetical protein
LMTLLCIYPDAGPRTQEHKLSHHSGALALNQQSLASRSMVSLESIAFSRFLLAGDAGPNNNLGPLYRQLSPRVVVVPSLVIDVVSTGFKDILQGSELRLWPCAAGSKSRTKSKINQQPLCSCW